MTEEHKAAGDAPSIDNDERPRLTPERIFEAALELIDQEGLDALTMRRLGSALGVFPTAIYWHVRTRQELLRGVLDLTMKGVEIALPTWGSWDQRAKTLCVSIREQLIAHPNVLTLAEQFPSKAIGPVMATWIGIARDAGYGEDEASIMVGILLNYTIGSVWVELHPTQDVDFPRVLSSAGDPVQMLKFLQGFNYDRTFERGLDLILDGLDPRRKDRGHDHE